jgi:hypothetical protein
MLKLLLKKKTKKVKSKKSSVMDLVRKNQMAYEKFITKKVSKLLRALGVSSDSRPMTLHVQCHTEYQIWK